MTIQKVFYRSPHNYDLEEASKAVTIKDFGPSMTVQAMAEDADINVIMHRFGITGKFPENPRVPTYQDFDDIFDYRTALERTKAAEGAFMQYPAIFRARFDNNPQAFMEFCSNPQNKDAMREMGLLKPTPEPSKDPNASVVEAITSLKGVISPPVPPPKATT